MANVVKDNGNLKDAKRRQMQTRIVLQVSLVMVVCVGIFAYKVGKTQGFNEGLNAGYAKAGQEIVSSWRAHTEEMKLARGRDSL